MTAVRIPPVAAEVVAIRPGSPLTGSVTVDGSKNAALPLLAAAAALHSPVHLGNVPANADVETMLALLQQAGWHTARPVSDPQTPSRRDHNRPVRPRPRLPALLTVIGIRRHLLRWRCTPSPATIGRVLGAVDGDALDRAVGAYLADRHRAATEPAQAPSPSASGRSRVIAVDGKALKGSARLIATRRHLLSAVTHGTVVTLAQMEIGARRTKPCTSNRFLAPLDLAGAVVTFDALHSVKANISWLVEAKQAHYIAVIKTNQPTAHSQLAALPWRDIAVQHIASASGHGRRESRSIKTCAVADELGGIAFPHARLAIRVHRRRKQTGKRETRESVYAVTSLDAHQAGPADLTAAIRGHWGVENSSHHIRDVTFTEDASTVHAGTAPRAMATLRNLAIGVLKTLGADNIAKTTRAIRDEPQRALPILGITNDPDSYGT